MMSGRLAKSMARNPALRLDEMKQFSSVTDNSIGDSAYNVQSDQNVGISTIPADSYLSIIQDIGQALARAEAGMAGLAKTTAILGQDATVLSGSFLPSGITSAQISVATPSSPLSNAPLPANGYASLAQDATEALARAEAGNAKLISTNAVLQQDSQVLNSAFSVLDANLLHVSPLVPTSQAPTLPFISTASSVLAPLPANGYAAMLQDISAALARAEAGTASLAKTTAILQQDATFMNNIFGSNGSLAAAAPALENTVQTNFASPVLPQQFTSASDTLTQLPGSTSSLFHS
jgi:hypothetical protein